MPITGYVEYPLISQMISEALKQVDIEGLRLYAVRRLSTFGSLPFGLRIDTTTLVAIEWD